MDQDGRARAAAVFFGAALRWLRLRILQARQTLSRHRRPRNPCVAHDAYLQRTPNAESRRSIATLQHAACFFGPAHCKRPPALSRALWGANCSYDPPNSMVDRAALVRRARQRCMDLYPDCHIVSHLHVGDAPQDMQAAELGGAIALGVCVTTEHLSAWGRVGRIGAGIGEVPARWW